MRMGEVMLDVRRMSAAELDRIEAAIKERRKILRQGERLLPKLEEKRAKLAAELKAVEEQIAVFTGTVPAKRPARPAPKRKVKQR